jgi:hypothetical protein
MRTDTLAGTPGRLRSFDPARVADLEFRAWGPGSRAAMCGTIMITSSRPWL